MLAVKRNVPLSGLNTMGVEGLAAAVVTWTTPGDLQEFFSPSSPCADLARNARAIGEGSNLLFVNNRFDGTLLLCDNCNVETSLNGEEVILTVGAGMKLDTLVQKCVENNFWGIENLALIPGTVGAAAVQNVGAYGVEFGSLVTEVECFDRLTGKTITIQARDIHYGYRNSIFKHSPAKERYIITAVTVRLSMVAAPNLSYGNLRAKLGDFPSPADIYTTVCETRRFKLPEVSETGSAGSYFKNPVVTDDILEKVYRHADELSIARETIPVFPVNLPDGSKAHKLSAAWLIDRSGWKGVKEGNVGTWPSQPLVIVNLSGKATGREVEDLATRIRDDVYSKWNVRLVPEVEYIY